MLTSDQQRFKVVNAGTDLQNNENSPLKGNPESLKSSEAKPQLRLHGFCTFLPEVRVHRKP